MEAVGPLSKRCRLCADERGPFLNIFGADAQLASKIRQLLPLVVDEWDDLPHKSCFRCSAKIVELHEFTEKCLETQETFLNRLKINTKRNIAMNHRYKSAREAWEAKLKSKNISNNEYCDRLVQKALNSFSSSEKSVKYQDKNDDRLKELKIVLQRIDHTSINKKSNYTSDLNKQDDGKKKPMTSVPGELLDNISYIDVSGVDSIYSCKVCNRIFTQKQKINSHICKGNLPESDTEAHSTQQFSDSFSGYVQNVKNSESNRFLPNVSSVNASGVSITTSTQTQYLIKTQDNKFFIMPSSDAINVSKLVQVPVSDSAGLQNLSLNALSNESSLQGETTDLVYDINKDPFALSKEKNKEEYNANSSILKKSKEKKSKTIEPYPVSLFYTGNKGIHNTEPLNLESRHVKKNKKHSSKKYKVMLHEKPGKMIIANVDKKNKEKYKPSSVIICEKKKGSNYSDIAQNYTDIPESKVLNVTQRTHEDKQFFTIHNIDSISSDCSSYVLPTTSIVQESLISTTAIPTNHQKLRKRKKDKVIPQLREILPLSTAKCSICDLHCEKNMLSAHIKSHFIDENTVDRVYSKARKKRKCI